MSRLKKHPIRCWCHSRAEDIISHITIFLNMVMSRLYDDPMLTSAPIEVAMRERLRHEVESLVKNHKRMRELASVYNEMEDLKADSERRKARIERLLGILGIYNEYRDGYDDGATDAMSAIGAEENDSSLRLPLWQAMVEYLLHAKEARIAEMENFFQEMHVGANRQAIESALKRHPSVFRTRRQKREKYISLKGDYAAAANDVRK